MLILNNFILFIYDLSFLNVNIFFLFFKLLNYISFTLKKLKFTLILK